MRPQTTAHVWIVEVQGSLGMRLVSSRCSGPHATVMIVTSMQTQLHSERRTCEVHALSFFQQQIDEELCLFSGLGIQSSVP